MRGSGGRLCFSKKKRYRLWKDHIHMIYEEVLNEKNAKVHDVEADVVEAPLDSVGRDKVVQVLK